MLVVCGCVVVVVECGKEWIFDVVNLNSVCVPLLGMVCFCARVGWVVG